ncbi:hypothetical protein HDE_01053 [Halotydeus destructor]|nr:hypothetical protein HDE_01053 [Halotydeus destructor]
MVKVSNMWTDMNRASAKEAIGPLDYLLTVFGNRLFADTVLAKNINRLFKAILILVLILYYRWLLTALPGVKLFQAIRWSVAPTATIVIHIILAYRRGIICELLEEVCQHFTRQDMTNARRNAIFLSLAMVAITSTSFASDLYEFYGDKAFYSWYNETLFGKLVNGYKWYHEVVTILVWSLHSDQVLHKWIASTVVFYIHVYYLVHLRQKPLIQLMKSFREDKGISFYITLTKKLSTFNTLKRDMLDDKLNIFPFMWFASLFVSLVGLVQHLTASNLFGRNAKRFLGFSTESFFVFGALIYVINAENQSQAEMSKFRLQLLQMPKHDVVNFSVMWSLLKTMQDKVRLTAWSFYDLDRPLLLSFASAIVSFTVLFHQLNSGK